MQKSEAVWSLNRRRYDSPHSMGAAHIHKYHELYYLENGSTSYFCESSIYRLHTGDLIFVPKGKFHRTENAEHAGLTRVLFHFDDRTVGEEYLPSLEELAKFPHIVLPEQQKPQIRRLIEKIEAEEMNEEGNLLLKKLYFCELLLLLLRYRRLNVIEAPTGSHKIAQDAARYISQNYREELSLEMLAKQYAVSAGYFSKLFKKHTGAGVSEYITVTRILAAKELLEMGEMTVTEVAFAVGFNDSNYFSQIFKRNVGSAPKQYAMSRKNNGARNG